MSSINQDTAAHVLAHLVDVLADPPSGLERYGDLFPRGRPLKAVRELLSSCMREQIFDLFSDERVPSYQKIRYVPCQAGTTLLGQVNATPVNDRFSETLIAHRTCLVHTTPTTMASKASTFT